MNKSTLLHRQVHTHPSFTQIDPETKKKRVTSQAFMPSTRDGMLSTYDGDKISAADSWARHTNVQGLKSCGVMSVSVGECANAILPVIPDGTPYPEHVSINFNRLTEGQKRSKSKQLRAVANKRGWQYIPDPAAPVL